MPVKVARRAACDTNSYNLDGKIIERFDPFHRVVACVQLVTQKSADGEGKLRQETGPAATPAKQDHRLALREWIQRSLGSTRAPLLIHIRDL